MPRLRTPDNTARRYLFAGNKSALIRNTGISRATFYSREKRPGTLTLDELAALVREQGLDAEELYKIITERG